MGCLSIKGIGCKKFIVTDISTGKGSYCGTYVVLSLWTANTTLQTKVLSCTQSDFERNTGHRKHSALLPKLKWGVMDKDFIGEDTDPHMARVCQDSLFWLF